jgi:outer membrane protein assembly factor BamB
VLNPGTGEVLWQRRNLEPKQGLFMDANMGLFGDREVLVLFSDDRSSYTVFKTLNGEELRRGKLDINVRQNRMVFGRNLVYVSESPTPALRMWDPLSNRMLLDESFAGRALSEVRFAKVRFSDELVLALPSGRVRVIDGRSGAVRLDLQLNPEALTNVNLLVAFADDQRYYINLQRSAGGMNSANYGYVSDSFLPVVPIQGDLYAVDIATGKLLWSRPVPQQSIVYTPEYRLPFLVALSRVRSRAPNGANQSLRVDLIDCQTGEALGSKSNIVYDRLLQMGYERDAGRFELRGAVVQVRVEFETPGAASDRSSGVPSEKK